VVKIAEVAKAADDRATKKGSSLDASAPRLLARQYAIPGRHRHIALELLRITEWKMAKAGQSALMLDLIVHIWICV
jgi:hypothetical protein